LSGGHRRDLSFRPQARVNPIDYAIVQVMEP
jgi:hypothetical protein